MRLGKLSLALGAMLVAATAFAHSGVKNPAVMKRMQGMSAISDATKVLGEMAKGNTAFDMSRAEAALAVLSDEAAAIPALFKAPEDDPKSESLPAIWENFPDFTAKAEALGNAARAGRGNVATLADLRARMNDIGQSCKSCHRAYRK